MRDVVCHLPLLGNEAGEHRVELPGQLVDLVASAGCWYAPRKVAAHDLAGGPVDRLFMHPQLDHLAHRLQTFDLMLLPQLEEFGEDVVVEEVHQRARCRQVGQGIDDGDQADKEDGGQQSQPERGAAEQVSSTHAGPHGASSRQ